MISWAVAIAVLIIVAISPSIASASFFRVVPIFTDFSAEENHLFILAKSPRAQSGAHAVFGDELLGDFGGSLQVV